jgi:hypothetical protein
MPPGTSSTPVHLEARGNRPKTRIGHSFMGKKPILHSSIVSPEVASEVLVLLAAANGTRDLGNILLRNGSMGTPLFEYHLPEIVFQKFEADFAASKMGPPLFDLGMRVKDAVAESYAGGCQEDTKFVDKEGNELQSVRLFKGVAGDRRMRMCAFKQERHIFLECFFDGPRIMMSFRIDLKNSWFGERTKMATVSDARDLCILNIGSAVRCDSFPEYGIPQFFSSE